MILRSNGWAHSFGIDTLMKLIFPVFRVQGDRVVGCWVVMRTGMQGNGVADAAERNRGEYRQKDRQEGIGPVRSGSRGDKAGWRWSGREDRTGSAGRISDQDCDRFFDLSKTIRIDMRRHMEVAAIRKKEKQDLLASLPRLLQSYTTFAALQAIPFRVAINNIIMEETATRCSIHLTSEELLGLWRDVG